MPPANYGRQEHPIHASRYGAVLVVAPVAVPRTTPDPPRDGRLRTQNDVCAVRGATAVEVAALRDGPQRLVSAPLQGLCSTVIVTFLYPHLAHSLFVIGALGNRGHYWALVHRCRVRSDGPLARML